MVGILTISGWKGTDIAQALRMSVATVYPLHAQIKSNPSYQKVLKQICPTPIEFTPEYREPGIIEKLLSIPFLARYDRAKLSQI
jgi:hypothetical protein